jgi:hypothetical protein
MMMMMMIIIIISKDRPNIQSECSILSNFLCCTVPGNNHYTLLLENISLYFVQQQVSFLRFFLYFFFPSSYASFHTFIYERNCTSLQCF